MEITGFDYIILSNIGLKEMLANFEVELRKIWPQPIVETVENVNNERIWLFFAEDEVMDEEDRGYELNEKGQGCFSIIATKLTSFDGLFSSHDNKDVVTSEVRLLITEIWRYTLVLPGEIDESPFVRQIYELVCQMLRHETPNELRNQISHRSVQYFIGKN